MLALKACEPIWRPNDLRAAFDTGTAFPSKSFLLSGLRPTATGHGKFAFLVRVVAFFPLGGPWAAAMFWWALVFGFLSVRTCATRCRLVCKAFSRVRVIWTSLALEDVTLDDRFLALCQPTAVQDLLIATQDLELAPLFPKVRKVTISGGVRLGAASLASVCCWQYLSDLTFYECAALDDRALMDICSQLSIAALTLQRCSQVTDVGVVYALRKPLESLTLNDMSTVGERTFASVRALRTLNLERMSLSPKDLPNLAHLPGLRLADCWGVSKHEIRKLVHAPGRDRKQVLFWWGTPCGGTLRMQQRPSVRHFEMRFWPSELGQPKHIFHLHAHCLTNLIIVRMHIETLPQCPSVQRLYFVSCVVADPTALTKIANMSELRVLTIHDTQFVNADLRCLGNVNRRSDELKDTLMAVAAMLPNLTDLRLNSVLLEAGQEKEIK